jgi:pectinesterase
MKIKTKTKLTPLVLAYALPFLATVPLIACGGGGSKSGTGGSTGSGGSTPTGGRTGSGGADGGTSTGGTDGGTSDAGDGGVPTGPCVPPTGGTVPSGTTGLQAAGPAVAATATRPQFSMATADANYTIAKFLVAGGNVASTFLSNGVSMTTFNVPMVDNWDPVTNGIGDVSTFTPMFTVASDGSGNFTSVQAAIAAARAVNATACARAYIRIKPGTYREVLVVSNRTSASPVTLYSTDADASKTTIVFGNAALTLNAAGAMLGTSGSATFTQSSTNFQAKNLTFSNDYVETGASNEQAVAFLNQGDRAQFENVRFLGNQDTLYVKTVNTGTVARAYFRDCYVEGDTDFIFGRGTTVFDHCEVHTRGNNKLSGTATSAPSTEVSNQYGFLYVSSNFTADSNVAANTTYFARQWYESSRPQAVGKMIIRNSTIGPHIIATGPWQPWAGRTILAPSPDAGADAGTATSPISTALFTSDDYYQLIGGAPVPAEPYIGEYGNSTGAAPTADGGTDAPADAPAPADGAAD